MLAMKKIYFLSWIFFGLSIWGHAQKMEGYILTLQQDTLYGKVLTEPSGLAPITFIYEKQRMNYHPSSIQFFGIFRNKEYQHFKALKTKEGRAYFVQIMSNGKLNFYKYSEEHIFTYATLNRYVYLMGTSDNQLTTLSSSSYQRILGDFLEGQPALLSKLEDTSFEEVPLLIELYNELL